MAVAFLGLPPLAGVPAKLVEGCGDWIVAAGVLELLSMLGFVVFFKLVFAAPVRWRGSIPAGLRALAANTVLPAGGVIGPTIGGPSGRSAPHRLPEWAGIGRGPRSPLASRHEVGDILRSSGIATTELRASIVIGVGSASFETVRTIVERLPAIPAPSWVDTAAQPIAIDDVIEYLFAAKSMQPRRSTVFEIGGKDRVTYADVMREYARQRKLRRPVLSLPVVSGRAWRRFLGVLIPVHGRVAGAMVDSLRNETVVSDPAARAAFTVQPRGLPEAIARTLALEDHDSADTSWRDVLPAAPAWHWGGSAVRGPMVSSRVLYVSGSPTEEFASIQRIGGPTGWYGVDWFWYLRGLLVRLRGAEGMRRGRRNPDHLAVGDTIDFWRVERIEAGRRLLLAAEMKLPGRLWLQFDVTANGHTPEIRQTTVFDPAGYIGLAYWYLLYPVHHTIFAAMLRATSPKQRRPSATRSPFLGSR